MRARQAFTIVEFLVATAIIGILVALLLPAALAAREAARKVQCSNHLKQIGLAFITHHDTHGHFPTGGWRSFWIGEARYGFGRKQPGGWTFNILPYIDQHALHELGAGLRGDALLDANTQRIRTPLKVMHCPSRRGAQLYAAEYGRGFANGRKVHAIAKFDYAANAGQGHGWEGNTSHQSPFSKSYKIALHQASAPQHPPSDTNRGIVWFASMTRMAQVTDGATRPSWLARNGASLSRPRNN